MPVAKAGELTPSMVDRYQKDFASKPAYRMALNAVTRGNLNEIALNREALHRASAMTFSIELESGGPITDQARAGTCWLFAGLNWLRVWAKRKLKAKSFTWSENYALFWDKLEKANYFFENMIDLRDRDLDDRWVHHFLDNPSPDGGEWNMVVNIIKKYGLVPREAMSDTFNRENSRFLDSILGSKLREGAARIRTLHGQGKSLKELRAVKDAYMSLAYRILAIHLGEPPKRFSWAYKKDEKPAKGKKKAAKKADPLTRFENVTPQEFYKKACGVDPDDIFVLVSSPMKSMPYKKPYQVRFFNNTWGGSDQVSLNLPVEDLKQIALKILKAGDPVLFGCEVRLDMHSKEGILDRNLFAYDLVFDTDFPMNKAERLETREAIMTHAMVFTGVDLVGGKPVKWKVENSWGEQFGKKGYFVMTDDWFDEHVFEVVTFSKFLTPAQKKLFKKDPVILPPWHPFG